MFLLKVNIIGILSTEEKYHKIAIFSLVENIQNNKT